MRTFDELLPRGDAREATLVLPLDHEQRRRARLRVMLPSGEAIGISLPRGGSLRDGDKLRASADGTVARVRAAPEHVSVAETSDAHLLTRGAYHLGNRHVALRIERVRLIYPHDHVLDGLCRELGLSVSQQILPFEPEPGGYAGEHSHGGRLRPEPGAGRG
ncbi:MAG TPA: urease accessory protein UreE [Polyangiaceae bacterium]|nr:urease accessory protein UreE [Polyangiaceae bacterium]